jgi:hypothetical protein
MNRLPGVYRGARSPRCRYSTIFMRCSQELWRAREGTLLFGTEIIILRLLDV